jgi:glycosyltransferase involved in cell wall biosynthesis
MFSLDTISMLNNNLGRGHVYHFDEDHSPAHAGITAVVSQLSGYLTSQGVPTTILTAGEGSMPTARGVELIKFPLSRWGRRWRYPVGMKTYLGKLANLPGIIFHLHGPWGAPQWLAALAAKRHKVAALLTPHGVLEPWHWKYSLGRQLRYLTYWRSIAYPAFRHLAVIHAITSIERDNLERLFPHQRIEVIPNAVNLAEIDKALATCTSMPSVELDGRYLLFLGQLHPKKGIDILIQSFSKVCQERDFHLLIVGPDKAPEYTRKLKALAGELAPGRVIFPGPVYSQQKWRLYQDAWAVCLPSNSEVVGMVNLEAAAAGTPVITSHVTGLFDWEEGGGILIQPEVDELSRALAQVVSWDEPERLERGRRLRRLVERRYSLEAVGPLWLDLYSELLETVS